MIRQYLNTGQGERDFRWRGGSVSRIEGLTDGVFAIALTLLVVSLEVPSSWTELKAAFVQLPVFLVCFALLYYIWYSHYIFHRRYGLETRITIWLNAVLIFLVLFYVYPLKFLSQVLYGAAIGGKPVQRDQFGEPLRNSTGQEMDMISQAEMPELMLVYSAGFLGIFLTLGLGSLYAWRYRQTLELTAVEETLTLSSMREQGIMVVFAAASLTIVALRSEWAPFGGMIYVLVGPLQGLNGWWTSKRAEQAAKG